MTVQPERSAQLEFFFSFFFFFSLLHPAKPCGRKGLRASRITNKRRNIIGYGLQTVAGGKHQAEIQTFSWRNARSLLHWSEICWRDGVMLVYSCLLEIPPFCRQYQSSFFQFGLFYFRLYLKFVQRRLMWCLKCIFIFFACFWVLGAWS